MIAHLNPMSFAPYGEVPEVENLMKWDGGEGVGPLGEAVFRRYPDHPAELSREEGMSVLAVSADGLRTITRFYLDKPVRLRPGIWHAVTFLGGEGRARRSVPEGARWVERAGGDPPEARPFAQSLLIHAIYTLFYQERERGFFFPGEQHRPWELVYVDKGRLHSVAGGRDHPMRQGELMLYLPGQWHMQYTQPDQTACFVTVSFEMDCSYGEMLANRVMAPGDTARSLLGRMLREGEEALFLREDMLACHLKELLVHLLRRERERSPALPLEPAFAAGRENEIVERAQRYIGGNLGARLTVERVAGAVSVSASYLSTLFRRHLGMPPGRYMSKVRLGRAKELLREGEHNVSEIAGLLGYATVQHFSRCFKAEFGVPPTEYAKAIR